MDSMCNSARLRDVFHTEATLHPRIRGGKMVALQRFYLHPQDQVDLTNSLFAFDTRRITLQTAFVGQPDES